MKGKGAIADEDVDAAVSYHDGLGILECLGSRVKNMSQGLAFGGYALIESHQTQWGRKHVRPRSFVEEGEKCRWFFTTRVLRL